MENTLKGWIEAGFNHSEAWGMVWFGLIFWGSIIYEVTLRLMPAADHLVIAWAAYATGLAIGAMAKARGRWL